MPDTGIDNAFTASDLKTHSTDRTFAGVTSFARRKYTKDVSGADAVVWGVPLDVAVSNRPGTRSRTPGHPCSIGDHGQRPAISVRRQHIRRSSGG